MKTLIIIGLVILAAATVFLFLKKDKKAEQPPVTPQPTPPAEY